MQRSEKEQVVAELTERLRVSQALIVADYRGLTNAQLEGLRGELDKHGARLSVVKNTLTRLAAEAAGADAVLALLEGPTAIAFIESDGDPVAVAKALGQTARETRVLAVRGGVLEGRSLTSDEVDSLSKLPPLDVLRGQVLGAITSPLYAIVGLFTAPLQDLHGLIDARITQLEEEQGAEVASAGAEATGDGPGSREEASSPEEESAREPQPERETQEPETPTADATESAVAEVASVDAEAQADASEPQSEDESTPTQQAE